jgi:4-hydroxy-tetrahydrodipicolinate synthase
LAEHPRIIGLKDATGDIARPLRLRSILGREFRLLSGDDASAMAFMASGGDGCISVTSNLAPRLCRSVHLACVHGDLPEAQRLAASIARLAAVLFRETNPTPLKYALSLCDLMSPRVRLPLIEPMEATKREVEAVLARFRDGDSGFAIENSSRGDTYAIAS